MSQMKRLLVAFKIYHSQPFTNQSQETVIQVVEVEGDGEAEKWWIERWIYK